MSPPKVTLLPISVPAETVQFRSPVPVSRHVPEPCLRKSSKFSEHRADQAHVEAVIAGPVEHEPVGEGRAGIEYAGKVDRRTRVDGEQIIAIEQIDCAAAVDRA